MMPSRRAAGMMPMVSGSTNTMPCSTRVAGGVTVRPSAPKVSDRTLSWPSVSLGRGIGTPRRLSEPSVKVPLLVVVAPVVWMASQRMPRSETRPPSSWTSASSVMARASRTPGLTTPDDAVLVPPLTNTEPTSPRGATWVTALASGSWLAEADMLMTPPRLADLPAAAPSSSALTITGCGCLSRGRVGASPSQPSAASVTPMTPRLIALLWALDPVFWWPATDSPAVMPKLRFPKIGLSL